MSRFILFFLCFLFCQNANAQLPSYWQMELERKTEELRIQDSMHRSQDSLRMLWVKMPSADRPNQFIDSLKNAYTVKSGDLSVWMGKFGHHMDTSSVAKVKVHRKLWTLLVVGLLLFLFSVLKYSYSSQLNTMMQATYSSSALAQLNKEDKIYNRWSFVLLYVLFGFVFGMFVFLGVDHYLHYQGPSFYLMISFGVIAYFSLKVFVLKILGFVFEVQALTKEYNSILFLSYFTAAVFLLPVVLIFSFLPQIEIGYLFVFISFFLFLFFSLQQVRLYNFILKTYKLSKFYLFLYFCTLEIGPLIIIIKTIGL